MMSTWAVNGQGIPISKMCVDATVDVNGGIAGKIIHLPKKSLPVVCAIKLSLVPNTVKHVAIPYLERRFGNTRCIVIGVDGIEYCYEPSSPGLIIDV